MALWERYIRPNAVEEALAELEAANGRASLVAGGTDLLLDMQQGRHPPVDALVDISRIPELMVLKEEEDQILLGAAVVHRAIVESDLIRHHARCLAEACVLIGGPQVRNVATLGGNVAHALPAGDGTIALLALKAEAQIASKDGRRWELVEKLFRGPGETTFDRSREVLVTFRIPRLKASEGTAFRRVMRPQGVAIAILNMAVWVRLAGDGSIGAVRISVGPAGPRPLRARRTEQALRGGRLDSETLTAAAESLLAEVSLRTSLHRATKSYREHLIPILMARTLTAAHKRALEQTEGVNS